MKKVAYSIVFMFGVGIAVWGTAHYSAKKTDSYYAQILSIGEKCTAPCCLPNDMNLDSPKNDEIMKLEGNYCQCRNALSLQIDQKRLALADMLLKTKPDSSAIETLLEDIARLQVELEKQTITHLLTIKSKLEPGQQERFILPIVKEIRRRCHHQGCLERHQ